MFANSINGRLTRRRFLRAGAGAVGAAAAGCALGAGPRSQARAEQGAGAGQGADARKPNIVLILADDLGYGDLGCFGQERLKTPVLDRLADRGLRFTDHYAGSTVCAPSRCVLLTGLDTGHARIRGNSPGLLTEADLTVAQVLKRAGYATGCVGKWGVGHPPPPDDPARRGFDYAYGYVSMYHAHNFYPEFVIRNGEQVAIRNEVPEKWKEADGRGVATRKVDYVPDLVAREALAFVERNKDRPFFLYWALNVPHANNEAGKEGIEVPDQGPFAGADWPEQEKNFASVILRMDRDVGRLVEKLDALGLADRTLVLFTSDNGPHQEGGHSADFFESSGPLRGKKRDLTEGGIRVPTIAYWPGTVPAGRTTGCVSGFVDYFPTFAELAGAAVPATDGISLVPTLTGRPEAQKPHAYLYWEFHERGFSQAVRFGQWKAVRNGSRAAPVELYDLSADIGEEHDVAADRPDLVEKAKGLFQTARTESDAYPIRERLPKR